MQPPSMSILDWLNRYANLLLVVITAVYAFLTWQTLAAMKRANSLQQRARHLDRIKQSVASPILNWLTNEVAGLLTGTTREPVHLVYENPAQPGGQRPNRFAQDELTVFNLDLQLFDDTLHSHFHKQLENFNGFNHSLRELLTSFLHFAERSRQEVEKDRSLPPHDGTANQQRFADCPTTIRVYLRDLISGETSAINLRGNPGGIAVLESPYSGGFTLAMAPYAELAAWLERFKRSVNGFWQASGLPERVGIARNERAALCDLIGQIDITETLPGNCKYVAE